MQNLVELNRAWEKALRSHAASPLMGANGAYRPIGGKTMGLLEALWARPGRTGGLDVGALISSGRIVRFWADPHFGHDNIRRMCHRDEFPDVEAMDAALMERALEAAADCDLLVCVGDLSLKNPVREHRRLMDLLGDRHVLLVGNHDVKGASADQWVRAGALASLAFRVPSALLREWIEEDEPEMAELVEWRRLPKEVPVGCSHWPMPPRRFPGSDWLCLHGHIHDRPAKPLRMNCSVEAIGYRPKTLRELVSAQLLADLALRTVDPHRFDPEDDVDADADADMDSGGRGRFASGGQAGRGARP